MSLIAAVGQAMADAPDFDAAMERLASQVTGALGDLCLVDVLTTEGRIRRIAAVHVDAKKQPSLNRLRDRFPTIEQAPITRSLRPQDPPADPRLEVATLYLASGDGVEVGGDFFEVWEAADGAWWVAIGGRIRERPGRGASEPAGAPHDQGRRHDRGVSGRGPAHPQRGRARAGGWRALLHRRGVPPRPRRWFGGRHDRVRRSPDPVPGASRGVIEEAGFRGTLLGLVPDIDVEECSIGLGPGDGLVCYADGLVEERLRSRQFGVEGLVAELEGATELDLPDHMLVERTGQTGTSERHGRGCK
ncbi:MAG: serine/threonine-protein phosphatase, partial [Actinomycetota bacterium]|nr:serine/threonine-protein phosphatase [Actinomycetota bacterium]